MSRFSWIRNTGGVTLGGKKHVHPMTRNKQVNLNPKLMAPPCFQNHDLYTLLERYKMGKSSEIL